MSEVSIRPQTVEQENSVKITYTSPKAVSNQEEPYCYRPFTIAELEDVLFHARANDAEDDTLINIDTWRNCTIIDVTLPKHWADVSTPPEGRYAPVEVQFWHGWWSGLFFAGIVSLIVIFVALVGP